MARIKHGSNVHADSVRRMNANLRREFAERAYVARASVVTYKRPGLFARLMATLRKAFGA
jgi:hypothetical protein